MRASKVMVADVTFVADLSGALFWQEQRLLVVSDLHLEKGSSFASRGTLLPPFDTVATLRRLAAVIAHYDPRTVIALGDSFHDRDAHMRLSGDDRACIANLQVGRDWIWITGNHDPAPHGIGGEVADEITLGAVTFRHEPTGARGEIGRLFERCDELGTTIGISRVVERVHADEDVAGAKHLGPGERER